MEILIYLIIGFVAVKMLTVIVQVYMWGRNKREARALMKEHPHQAAEIWSALQIREAASDPVVSHDGGGLSKLLIVVLVVVYLKPDLRFLLDVVPGLRWCYDMVAGIIEFKKMFT
jgi:hypothetical protein